MHPLMLTSALLLATGLSVFSTAKPTQPVPAPPVGALAKPGDVDPEMPYFKTVAKTADDCARICDLCSAHCAKLLAEGRKEHLETLRTCADCAAICSTTSCVVARDGPMSDLMCAACADTCKRCGEACQKHAGDPLMKRCADECARCEKACRELLKPVPKQKGEKSEKK